MSDKVQVVFTGTDADVRILAAEDLRKAGVEEGFSLTRFVKNRPIMVTEEVAQALISDPDLFGKFELQSDIEARKAEADAAAEEAAKPAAKSKTAEPTSSGAKATGDSSKASSSSGTSGTASTSSS